MLRLQYAGQSTSRRSPGHSCRFQFYLITRSSARVQESKIAWTPRQSTRRWSQAFGTKSGCIGRRGAQALGNNDTNATHGVGSPPVLYAASRRIKHLASDLSLSFVFFVLSFCIRSGSLAPVSLTRRGIQHREGLSWPRCGSTLAGQKRAQYKTQ